MQLAGMAPLIKSLKLANACLQPSPQYWPSWKVQTDCMSGKDAAGACTALQGERLCHRQKSPQMSDLHRYWDDGNPAGVCQIDISECFCCARSARVEQAKLLKRGSRHLQFVEASSISKQAMRSCLWLTVSTHESAEKQVTDPVLLHLRPECSRRNVRWPCSLILSRHRGRNAQGDPLLFCRPGSQGAVPQPPQGLDGG